LNTQKNNNTQAFRINATDVFLVSFPKSGNTWMRFLLGNYLTKGLLEFQNVNSYIPEVHIHPERVNDVITEPRIIKSHFEYVKEYTTVIYIARDIRDVAISKFHHLQMVDVIPETTTLHNYLQSSFDKANQYGSKWHTHVFSWLRDNFPQRLLLLKYEDILVNPELELKKALVFMGLSLDEALLNLSIERSSFKSMRKKEEESPINTQELVAKAPLPNKYFVREGKTGSWRNEMNTIEKDLFWNIYGEALQFLGYPKD
jgi:hypothetical protein